MLRHVLFSYCSEFFHQTSSLTAFQTNMVKAFVRTKRPHISIDIDENSSYLKHVLTRVCCFRNEFMNPVIYGFINYIRISLTAVVGFGISNSSSISRISISMVRLILAIGISLAPPSNGFSVASPIFSIV